MPKVRTAKIDDSLEVLSMWMDMDKETDHGMYEGLCDGLERERIFSLIVQKINSGTDYVLVAENDGLIIGFIVGNIGHDGVHPVLAGHCSGLYVKPGARGKSVAKMLIESLEREFNEKECKIMEFSQNYHENVAKKWERRGYMPTSVIFQRKV